MGDEPIIIEQFFMGLTGLSWVQLWEVKILWVQIMGVTLVCREDALHIFVMIPY
jgi:hypothetical protein